VRVSTIRHDPESTLRGRPRDNPAFSGYRSTMPARDDDRDETENERLDRNLLELLNELRVALPGVQILFGFLLTVPFSQRFDRLSGGQRALFYATLLSTAASAVFMIAPSATHRLRFHQHDRTFVIESANKYLIAGLGFLAVAIILVVTLVTDLLYSGWVWVFPAAIGATLVFFWFVRPLLRH
jgi:hypothetical protein